MKFQYQNKTAKIQTLNLRSGASLFAAPHQWHPLATGDEHSEEIQMKVRQGKGYVMLVKEEQTPDPVMESGERDGPDDPGKTPTSKFPAADKIADEKPANLFLGK